MKSFFPLLAAATSALAAPLAARQNQTQTYSVLKTQLINGPERFDNLYVESYHTGAGLSDATLASSTESAVKGFLNGTNWQLDLGTTFPWSMAVDGDSNYAAWEPVTINAGEASPGEGQFYVNATAAPGLLWGLNSDGSNDYQNSIFKNWLVCDWYHGVPQLFQHVSYYNYSIPDTCAEVWLIPETCA